MMGRKPFVGWHKMASEESWKQQDPQIPKSVWYHTDALFVGFRWFVHAYISSLEEIEKYWPSEEKFWQFHQGKF